MYMDVVVFAGIATVLLMVAFFVGVGIFVMRDQKSHAANLIKKDIKLDRKAA
ncbi:CcoQ/FixQ family Cbb3-type cytochrome c oxidase assembly chaperone [Marinobacter sp. 1-3A]|uniref:cytochrome c oxidase subunit CcoM n=1 Tax=Marinobacter sp. 1-3A TaxID=2582920 RepID=UPI001904156A|nr:CcoQ/FixQ family Cbb3-type cytochrome c oxidase assembly chaperone [Marinobacter sp. 1-3A]